MTNCDHSGRCPTSATSGRSGLVAGVELVQELADARAVSTWREQAGIRVCEAMSRRGVLTRPVGNVIVVMPPYCATRAQVRQMVQALGEAVQELSRQR